MPEESLLDFQLIEKLKTATAKRGSDFWISLVDHFFTQAEALISEISQSNQQGDMEQVNKIAHKLKGSAASFGAFILAQLCSEIENHSANHYNEAKIDLLVNQLEHCYINTRPQLLKAFKNK